MALRYVKIICEISRAGFVKSPSANLCQNTREFTNTGIHFKTPKDLRTSCDSSAKQPPCEPCPKKPKPCCRVTCRTRCVKLVRCCPPSAGCRPPCGTPAPTCPINCQSKHLLRKITPQKPCPSRKIHKICGVNQSGVNRRLESEEAERRRQYEEEVQIRRCLDIVKKPACSSQETYDKAMKYLQEKCLTEKNSTEECIKFREFYEKWCQENTSNSKPTSSNIQNDSYITETSQSGPSHPIKERENTTQIPDDTSKQCSKSKICQDKSKMCQDKSKIGPTGHPKWSLNSKIPIELGHCGPNRERPEPVIVELIENQDLHKCKIKSNNYIDPCEHKPKVIVTIDRSRDPKRSTANHNTQKVYTDAVETEKKCELNATKKKSCEIVAKSGEYQKPCVELDLMKKIKYRGADRGKCIQQGNETVTNVENKTKNVEETASKNSPKCNKPYSANFLTKKNSDEGINK